MASSRRSAHLAISSVPGDALTLWRSQRAAEQSERQKNRKANEQEHTQPHYHGAFQILSYGIY